MLSFTLYNRNGGGAYTLISHPRAKQNANASKEREQEEEREDAVDTIKTICLHFPALFSSSIHGPKPFFESRREKYKSYDCIIPFGS